MLVIAKQVEAGRYYLTTVSKGIKYGQGYKTDNEREARDKFTRLVRTYETKGAAYVARNGSD